jgi:hypothetical protein
MKQILLALELLASSSFIFCMKNTPKNPWQNRPNFAGPTLMHITDATIIPDHESVVAHAIPVMDNVTAPTPDIASVIRNNEIYRYQPISNLPAQRARTCPPCCVIDNVETHDGLPIPTTATATLCGTVQCPIVYGKTTSKLICHNTAACCCIIATTPCSIPIFCYCHWKYGCYP